MHFSDLPSEMLELIFSFVDNQTIFVLPRVCSSWRRICKLLTIQQIKWRDCFIHIDNFISMFERFKSIKSLSFESSKEDYVFKMHGVLTDKQFSRIVEEDFDFNFTDLESLHLPFVKISDESIIKMIKNFKNLKDITLSWSYEISSDGILQMIQSYPNLRSLKLERVAMDKRILLEIANCTELRQLSLNDCHCLSDSELFKIMEKCKELISLNLKDSEIQLDITNSVFNFFEYIKKKSLCKKLKEFEFGQSS